MADLRFPFISRSAHEEIVAILREQIAELKAERKTTINYITEQSAGRGLFEEVNRPVPVREVESPSYFAGPINETVRKHPRAALRKLQEDINREADQLSEARRIVDDTIKEGQASA